MPRRRARRPLPFQDGDFVRVAGNILKFAAETDAAPENIDHFWITIDAALEEGLQIAINTSSRSNRKAGFDPRMRMAILDSRWETLPPAGISNAAPLDYGMLLAPGEQQFTLCERAALQQILTEKCRRAIFLEAWGEFYTRTSLGIHQVHSRRASCSVARDIVGRDGAVRFYFADFTAEMLLLKFCGQL